MSEEVIKILDDLAQRFGIAINWADKNVVPYLQELFDKFINWEIWTSVMFGGIGLVLIIIGILIGVKLTKFLEKEMDDFDTECWLMVLCCSGIFLLIGGWMTFAQLYDIIECLTFPEKTLFDYVSNYTDND